MVWLLYSRHWRTMQRLIPLALVVLYFSYVVSVGNKFGIPDPYVRYALACVVVQAVALTVTTIALIGFKEWNARKAAKKERIVAEIREAMVEYALPMDAADSAPVERRLLDAAASRPDEFVSVWESTLHSVKGPAQERIQELFLKTGLIRKLESSVRDVNPGKAMRAVWLLRRLRPGAFDVKKLEQALNHPVEAVRSSACISLASSGTPEQQTLVLERLPNLPFWLRVSVFQQLEHGSPALERFLQSAFHSNDPKLLLAALEFLLSQERIHPVGKASGLAASPHVEVRIKFYRALPLLVTDEDPASLVKIGLRDADWRVRSMAVQACGKLRLASLAPELERQFEAAKTRIEAVHLASALAGVSSDAHARLDRFLHSDSELQRAVAAGVLEEVMLRPSAAPTRRSQGERG